MLANLQDFRTDGVLQILLKTNGELFKQLLIENYPLLDVMVLDEK